MQGEPRGWILTQKTTDSPMHTDPAAHPQAGLPTNYVHTLHTQGITFDHNFALYLFPLILLTFSCLPGSFAHSSSSSSLLTVSCLLLLLFDALLIL